MTKFLFPDVQNSGFERAHPGLLAVGALPGGRQVLRWPGHPSGPFAGSLLPLHLEIKGSNLLSLTVVYSLSC